MNSPRRGVPAAVVRYAVAWVAGTALIAVAIVALLRASERTGPPHPAPALLPASRAAQCNLAAVNGPDELSRVLPAVGNASRIAATPGVYADVPAATRQLAALRRGLVVIHYRASIPRAAVTGLVRLYDEDRSRVVLVAHRHLDVAVAATAWRRRLTCEAFDGRVVQALRTFRQRLAERPRPGQREPRSW